MTRTDEILAVQDHLAALIATHDLAADTVHYHGASHGRRVDSITGETAPILPTGHVTVTDPAELLRWARALDATHLVVDRSDVRETALRLTVWGHHGFDVKVGSAIERTSTRPPRLPGIAVDWPRSPTGRRSNRARITVDDLATVLHTLGLTTEVPA